MSQPRPTFALATQMGLGCNPSPANWYDNTNFIKLVDHRLVGDIPGGTLVWRMPTSPDETSWGSCQTHGTACSTNRGFDGPHQIWVVTNSSAHILATDEDGYPYIAVNGYGNGQFLYDAALQPLLGHGGFAPGMYTYMIFRRAIEWAFESAQRPVVKLSPWPYQYNAAFMIRHDLEDYSDEIADVASSALIEYTNGAYGDYYFCTGKITNDTAYDFATVVNGLNTAVSYGATIGPHNGGLPNPRGTNDSSHCCNMDTGTYEYWHWGLDEALDFPGGKDYASNSLAISFAQIEAWVTSQNTNPRVWVAPYFNATREDSYAIEEGLNVKITGDQKLTPFPSFTLSTRTDGKRYALLSEPVSDWFTAYAGYSYEMVAQSMDPWHEPGIHTTNTLHAGATFYYSNGLLLNFYAHGLTTGQAYRYTSGYLIPDYVQYCMNTDRFPRLWSTNARGVHAWWMKRATAQIVADYTTRGTHSVATVAITGATDADTAIEILASGIGAAAISQLVTNGVTNSATATANNCRTIGELIKVRVGATVTNVQLEYFPGAVARDDVYPAVQGQPLTKDSTSGVLSNDFSGTWTGLLAITNSVPQHGSLSWNPDNKGGFTYKPNDGFWGTECFTYEATDGVNPFGTATVTISVTATNGQSPDLYSDDFVKCKGTASDPWQVAPGSVGGTWNAVGGTMQGTGIGDYGYSHLNSIWTNYSVDAQVQLTSGSYGGGVGSRLNPSTGAHYAAWLYPGANSIKLVKFTNWNTWNYNGTASTPMAQTNVAVDNGWHPLQLICSNNFLQVFYHGTNVLTTSDTDSALSPYPTGAVSPELLT